MNPSEPNPYASPLAQSEAAAPQDPPPELAATLWQVVLAWERLRLAYLGWLTLVSLAVFLLFGLDAFPFGEFPFWATLFGGFVGANICFTAGHIVEILAALVGMPLGGRRWLRGMLFVGGTLFATLLTAIWIGIATEGIM